MAPKDRDNSEQQSFKLFQEPVLSHDPGGTRITLPDGVVASAIYGGPNDCYRYLLEWNWDISRPTLMAGMMNPSCAGHLYGDRTLAWVHRWGYRNGFGRLLVVNADAYRAADQARLAEVADPIGPENAEYILVTARRADVIILGYGMPKVRSVRDHGPRMARMLSNAGYNLNVWAICADGTPKHPLYVKSDVKVQPWTVST